MSGTKHNLEEARLKRLQAYQIFKKAKAGGSPVEIEFAWAQLCQWDKLYHEEFIKSGGKASEEDIEVTDDEDICLM